MRSRHVDSPYAIHHLTEAEKPQLFAGIHALLKPGGRAVFGDLMFRNPEEEARLAAEAIAAGHPARAADFEEEFFWYVDHTVPALEASGFVVTQVKRFSTLSWGISARKAST